MSEPALQPASAPRTVDGLLKVTLFNLRSLATKLGKLESEQEKLAWFNMKTQEARAQYVLECLLAWDAANHGTNGAAAPQSGAVVMGQAPMVAPVSAQALQAAGAATQQEPRKARRQPQTSTDPGTPTNGATPPSDLGAEVINLLTRIHETTQTLGEQMGKLGHSTSSAIADQDKKLQFLEKTQGEVLSQLQQMHTLQVLMFTAFLSSMQETMGAPMSDILGAAVGDSEILLKLVREASGKG